MKLQPSLQRIASVARQQMEEYVRAIEGEHGSWQSLGCYCAITTRFLMDLGEGYGYNITFAMGVAFDHYAERGHVSDKHINHCWALLDNTIYDLTATQFRRSIPPVNIVPSTDLNYIEIYRDETAMTRAARWPSEQKYSAHKRALEPFLEEAIELINS
jgi:hypothetical protein